MVMCPVHVGDARQAHIIPRIAIMHSHSSHLQVCALTAACNGFTT